MAEMILEQEAPTQHTAAPPTLRDAEAEEIARDLALMDELEAYVQSLPNRRAEAGLGPMPDNIREMAYEEREAALL